jgi:hypothetical protein
LKNEYTNYPFGRPRSITIPNTDGVENLNVRGEGTFKRVPDQKWQTSMFALLTNGAISLSRQLREIHDDPK